jgi:hypothetical protein
MEIAGFMEIAGILFLLFLAMNGSLRCYPGRFV